MPSTVIQARSRLGVAARTGTPEDVADARRELAAAKLEAAIQKALADAPPLTAEQRDRIAAALTPRPGGDGR